MRLLLGDAELRQQLDDPARLHFELSRQLVDPYLRHISGLTLPRFCP